MKAAEEILLQFYTREMSEPYGHVPFDVILKAINEARKATIIECAERAKSEWVRYGTNMGHAVEKQSILSLINELK